MPSPFPGMNPYLEHPNSWSNVHHRLITAIAIFLAPHLRPKYRVVVEEAIYQTLGQDAILVGIPDVSIPHAPEISNSTVTNIAVSPPPTQPRTVILPMPEKIRQGYLQVRDIATSEVVTVLEVLSPANKRPGEGRKAYEQKRQKIFASSTNLVEIDLLRKWESMPILPEQIFTHYRILVSRSQQRPHADLYRFNLPDQVPSFLLPLRPDDREPLVNLQLLLNEIYDQSSYDLVIDYSKEPIPALSETDALWADTLLREQGLR